MMRAGSSVSTAKPSARSAPTMSCVSRLNSAWSRVTVRSDSAARTSARFVMLFDPGSVTAPHAGRVKGTMGQRIEH